MYTGMQHTSSKDIQIYIYATIDVEKWKDDSYNEEIWLAYLINLLKLFSTLSL